MKDIDAIVERFMEAEDANFSLFNYVNEVHAEVEKLEEQIAHIKVCTQLGWVGESVWYLGRGNRVRKGSWVGGRGLWVNMASLEGYGILGGWVDVVCWVWAGMGSCWAWL